MGGGEGQAGTLGSRLSGILTDSKVRLQELMG